MKRYDTFGAYMFDLLFAPLKRGKQAANQLCIFFKVMGRGFDDVKAALFRVRNEANVATASEIMLPVHGQDRAMPRLVGEDAEAYRTRLSMKGLISEWGGTRQGVLYALTALGYDQSHIEPFSLQDPERWAEFIVYLKGSRQSGVTNLDVIDAEVRKAKEGSSRPAYGIEAGNTVLITSRLSQAFSDYPRCGQLRCGVWPRRAAKGHLLKSDLSFQGGANSGENAFPRVGLFAASEEFWAMGDYTGFVALGSELAVQAQAKQGEKVYLRCSAEAHCSPVTRTRGGLN